MKSSPFPASDSQDKAYRRVLPEAVYGELRKIAGFQLQKERSAHTLNPTALAHEAWLRLAGREELSINDRNHFMALAAGAMRRILIDYARSRNAEKRGGPAPSVTLVEENLSREVTPDILLALDELLERLARRHPRQARIIELWFFGGMKHGEISELLEISEPTIRRDWRLARAWLSRELSDSALPPLPDGDHE